jgi:UDPglucose--hexose-1-phosphate uridylyltransferase
VRSGRPGASWARLDEETPEERETCPFCEGREDQTPPEVFALPEGRAPDTPGWSVRVVPNKFPAFDRQEVVVHTPDHVRSIADLDAPQLGLVAEAWRARARAAREDGFVLFAGINEGKAAGSSLPHTHSQLVYLREEPPVQTAESGLADYLRWEREEVTRIVLERDGLVLLSPYAGRGPFECLIAPLEPEADGFESDRLGPALVLAAEALRRLREALHPSPANIWLHTGSHWHLELLPRLTVFASVEHGAGLYVNPLAPEEAAEKLRAATDRSRSAPSSPGTS